MYRYATNVDGTAVRAMDRKDGLVLVYDRDRCAARPRVHDVCNTNDRKANQDWRLLLCSIAFALAVLAIGFVKDQYHNYMVTQRLSNACERVIRVAPGTTLWGIAEAHPVAGVSTQELISWITVSNQLSTAALSPGQKLTIPCPVDAQSGQ